MHNFFYDSFVIFFVTFELQTLSEEIQACAFNAVDFLHVSFDFSAQFAQSMSLMITVFFIFVTSLIFYSFTWSIASSRIFTTWLSASE